MGPSLSLSSQGAESAAARADLCSVCAVRSRSICGVFDQGYIGRLDTIAVRQLLETGETLFSEGEDAASLYVITRGCVKLYRMRADNQGQIIGFLFPADTLGLVPGRRYYSYTAEAVTATSVCGLTTGCMEQLLTDFPQLQGPFLSAVWDRFAYLQDQSQVLGREAAVVRVACFLDTLLACQGSKVKSRDVLDLPMSHGDIADFLELSHDALSAAYSELKRRDVIDFVADEQVVIKARTRLAEIGGGENACIFPVVAAT